MSRCVSIDVETFSEVNLRVTGLDLYSSHPTFEVLMLAWAVDDEPPSIWFPADDPIPPRLWSLLRDPSVTLNAWNSQFERIALKRGLKLDIPYERWRCSMVRATMLALPGTLQDCGTVMGLGEDYAKNKDGKRLIGLFCCPHSPTKAHPYTRYTVKTHPEEWAKFVSYCLQDVVAERHINKKLARFPVDEDLWKLYVLDQKINDRGIPIDTWFVENAIRMVARHRAQISRDMRALTGLKNPNSTHQLLPWARARGYPFDSLGAARIRKAFEDFEFNMSSECQEVLKLRLTAAKTSVNKFDAIMQRIGADGRLRYQYQMCGAGRTLRWAGRGVQPQNLPRPKKHHEKHLGFIRQCVRDQDYDLLSMIFPDVTDALASSVRSAIAPEDDRVLRMADYSAVETRLIAWITQCSKLLQCFADDLDPYIQSAMSLFDMAYEDVDGDMRQKSKPVVLGGGFGLGGGKEIGKYPDIKKTGLMGYAETFGVRLDQAEAKRLVTVFRTEYHEIKQWWMDVKAAAIHCIETRQPTVCHPVSFDLMPPFLRMILPGGRAIYYLRPKLREETITYQTGVVVVDGVERPRYEQFQTTGITYEAKLASSKWGRVPTHGGKLLEQPTQSLGFKALADAMLRADAAGFNIVMHAHDEIVVEEQADDLEHTAERLCEIMAEPMPDLPDLILPAKGHQSRFYCKG